MSKLTKVFRGRDSFTTGHPGWLAANCLVVVVAVVFMLVAGGCSSPQRAYRMADSNHVIHPPPGDSVTNNPQAGSNHVFSVIEFDERGTLWDETQMTDAFREIERIKRAGQAVNLIVFVHGWKNDASPRSGNLRSFHEFIVALADQQTNQNSQVVGVYLGWRGHPYRYDSVAEAVTKLRLQLSIWDRKEAAARVGGVTGSRAIFSLASKAREEFAVNTNAPKSTVIVVGHSLGGVVVEEAVAQGTVVYQLIRSQFESTDRQVLKALADTIGRGDERVSELKPKLESIERDIRRYNIETISNEFTGELQLNLPKIEAAKKLIESSSNQLRQAWGVLDADAKFFADKISELLVKPGLIKPVFQAEDPNVNNVEYWRSFGKQSEVFLSKMLPAEDKTPAFDKTFVSGLVRELEKIKRYLSTAPNQADNEARLSTIIRDITQRDAAIPIASITTFSTSLNKARESLAELEVEQKVLEGKEGERKSSAAEKRKSLEAELDPIKIDLAGEQARLTTNQLAYRRQWNAMNLRPADLIILLNPASEGLTAWETIKAMQSETVRPSANGRTNLNDPDKPWIISISSEADSATKSIFPVAMRLNLPTGSSRRYGTNDAARGIVPRYYSASLRPGVETLYQSKRQKKEAMNEEIDDQITYLSRPAPHIKHLSSHTVTPVTNVTVKTLADVAAATQTQIATGSEKRGKKEDARAAKRIIAKTLLQLNASNTTKTLNLSQEDEANYLVGYSRKTKGFSTYRLAPREGAANRSGYWVFNVPSEFIGGHDDIFNENLYGLLGGLLRISHAQEPTSSPGVPSPPGK